MLCKGVKPLSPASDAPAIAAIIIKGFLNGYWQRQVRAHQTMSPPVTFALLVVAWLVLNRRIPLLGFTSCTRSTYKPK